MSTRRSLEIRSPVHAVVVRSCSGVDADEEVESCVSNGPDSSRPVAKCVALARVLTPQPGLGERRGAQPVVRPDRLPQGEGLD